LHTSTILFLIGGDWVDLDAFAHDVAWVHDEGVAFLKAAGDFQPVVS
jgi:hypothetical protein